MQTPSFPSFDLRAVLDWLHDAGITEWVGDEPIAVLRAAEHKPLTSQDSPAELRPRAALSEPASAARKTFAGPADLVQLTDLAQLNAWVGAFRDLSLCRTATQAVTGAFLSPSETRQPPRLVVVAEAPDAAEDQSGQAFTGPAHDLIRQALRHSPVPADRVYLTYLSKWRPPGQRSLSMPELELSQAVLAQELACLGPASVIMLGEAVTRALSRIAAQMTADPVAATPETAGRFPNAGRSRSIPEKKYTIVFKGQNSENRALGLQKAETLLKETVLKKRVWQNLLSFCQALPTS